MALFSSKSDLPKEPLLGRLDELEIPVVLLSLGRWNVEAASRRAARYLQQSRTVIEQSNFTDFVAKRRREEVQDFLLRASESDRDETFVAPFELVDETIYLKLTAKALEGDEGNYLRVILDEFTQFRQEVRKQKEATNLVDDLLRSSHFAIITYDNELNAQTLNPEARELFSIKGEGDEVTEHQLLSLPDKAKKLCREILNEPVLETIDERPSGPREPLIYKRVVGAKSFVLESLFNPIRDERHQVIGVVEFARDITEKIKLEQEAQYLRRLNHLVIENIPSAIFVYTPKRQLRIVNKAFADLIGLKDTDDATGKVPESLNFPEALIHIVDAACERIETKAVATPAVIERIEFASGPRRVRHRAVPIPGVGRRTPLIISILEDTTEEDLLQMQLVQSEKLAALGQLAAGIAHEMRSPLSTIYNAVYDLNEIVDKSNDEVEEDIGIAMEEITRTQGIINNLLEFARGGDDKPSAVDLNDLIMRTLRLMDKNLQHAQITVDTEYAQGDTRVYFSRNAMKQVLLNLLSNAVHAMPDGGELYIGTCIDQPNDQIHMMIRDNGSGMPEEVRQRIFEPFYTTKEPGKGTGLGLSVVHSAVKEYDGSITVDSREGEGTCFLIGLKMLEKSKVKRQSFYSEESLAEIEAADE